MRCITAPAKSSSARVAASKRTVVCQATPVDRRQLLGAAGAALILSQVEPAVAAAEKAPKVQGPVVSPLCDEVCAKGLEDRAKTTASGLKYVDIVEGKGATPKVGLQVTVNYVAMTPEGRAFDSSLEKGYAYDIRLGTGQVIEGLSEGILGMKAGGIRRLYIPGNLAFPKGLASAAGRPRVPPSTPVIFDVQLLYIPGLSDLDEE